VISLVAMGLDGRRRARLDLPGSTDPAIALATLRRGVAEIAAGEAATGGPTRLSLTSSVGPVGTVGLKYRPGTRWTVFASYSISRVDTNLKTDTAGEIRTTHVAFRPQALVVGAGYSF